jgi:ABC-2 type transport system permease protein
MLTWTMHVYTMELRRILAYRIDFWVNIVGQTLFSFCLAYFLWKNIFEYNQAIEMGGMSFHQLMLYYLLAPLTTRMLQGENIGFISREIYDGTLNKYIVYPINVYQYKLITYCAHTTFFFLQFCAYLGLYMFFFYETHAFEFKFENFLMYVGLVLMGTLVYFVISTIIEMVAFWAEYIWSLGVMLRMTVAFAGGGLIPLSFFPEWGLKLLMMTPFPYFIGIPMKALMHGMSAQEYFHIMMNLSLWLIIFSVLAAMVWKRGKLKYTGVGI